jgi:hypothetical protein
MFFMNEIFDLSNNAKITDSALPEREEVEGFGADPSTSSRSGRAGELYCTVLDLWLFRNRKNTLGGYAQLC